MQAKILYEDNHLLIINKASGELAQGDNTGDIPLIDALKEFIKKRDHKPNNVFLGLVHRLDRPTSGILVFAKTSKALTRMNDLFKTREVKKYYWAITENKPPETKAKLQHYLLKNQKNNKTTVYKNPTEGAKNAILTYNLLGELDHYALLEVELFTGRSHQIRAQLAYIGCSIKGDLKYNAKRSNKDGSISLHARRIEFIHPIKKEKIEIIAPPPNSPIWEASLTFDV